MKRQTHPQNQKLVQLILIICTISISVHAQNLKQTIKGKVMDKISKITLPGATIIIQKTHPLIATTSDTTGNFHLENVPLGRYQIEVQFMGYEPVIIPEVLVGSSKEVLLNIEMVESVNNLREVVIKPNTNKDTPINSMAAISARSFNVEETRRYAGGLDDPARLVSAFAGVTSGGNNQDNAIVIRGNAPKNVLWRIEGVDIPNPNHFSGGNVAGGGFITTISSQMLGNSDFYTGAFPAEYGNALGGVFDIKLRTGNCERHEKTIQAGILGIDLSAEGPLKKGTNTSYLFNYRYSTYGLLSNLGLMPTDQTPVYQDLSFKIVMPTKKTGVFSLWGIGGIDNISDKQETDSLKWETDYDRMNNNWDEASGAVGLNNKYSFSNKTFISTSLVATGDAKELKQLRLDDDLLLQNDMNIRSDNGKIILNTFFNHKINRKLNTKTGFNLNTLFYNYDLNGTQDDNPDTYTNYTDDSGQSFHLQAYTELKYRLNNYLSLSGGIQAEYFALNNDFTFEPRIAVNWEFTEKQSLSFGYGKHSQLEDLNIYFIKIKENGEEKYVNKNLDFSQAQHFVLGYKYQINENLYFKMEPYFQYLYNIPGVKKSSFSMINFKQDLTFQKKLENNSVGKNMGIDITVEHFLKNNFYYLITSSVFDSKYRADDGVWRNTRYNKKYVVNLLFGKEYEIGKERNNLLGINVRGVISGGEYYTPLDNEASIEALRPVYDEQNAFSRKDGMSKFLNLSVSYRINKARHSSIWSLQINNLLGEAQYGEYEYNYSKKQCIRSSEVYRMPSFSYKLEF